MVYATIGGDSIYRSALATRGSAGPSGVSAEHMRTLLCSKKHRAVFEQLCADVSLVARRICTENVDPRALESFVSCRKIALPKDSTGGIRPIGIGEVLGRIIGKSITRQFSKDIATTAGIHQLCAGRDGGVEATIHAAQELFRAEESEAALLVDATNAFNSLNRKTALYNIQLLCPKISRYIVNTYRRPARLILNNGMEITSREGTTQGDNLAMAFYAVSIKPLIDRLKAHLCHQPWFADDAASIGKLQHVKSWWETLLSLGPGYGYYPRPDKCWLILKDETSKKVAEDLFASSKINITTEGHRYLGGTLGSAQFKQQYVGKLIEEWVIQIDKLSEMATREPHLSYAVFVKVMQSKWSFAMRTIPGIDDGLTKLVVHEKRSTLFPRKDYGQNHH